MTSTPATTARTPTLSLLMVGLGRMGAGMAERLQRGGHRVHGFDPVAAARDAAAVRGIVVHDSLEAAVAALPPPGIAWLMLPAGTAIDDTLAVLGPLLAPGAIVVDGGNSNYRDSVARAQRLRADGISYLDCGTSGGIGGLANGYSLMLGGDSDAVAVLQPALATLAPAADSGWGHVGPSGAGHFAKMVHNGIEYGLMQAYAEGFAILRRRADLVPDLVQLADLWRDGSVIRSWLLDLTADALRANPALEGIAPWVADSGEGRWTVAEAIDLDVPAPVITLALLERLRSRDDDSYTDRLLAAMRAGFGGHAVKRDPE